MALKTFVSGEVLTASDVELYLKNSIFARKTATESVTSSTTLQDDDHLTVSVAASSVYELSCMLKYDAGTAGDLKFLWSGPAGATLSWHRIGLVSTASVNTDVSIGAAEDISTEGNCGGLGAGSTQYVRIHGLLIVAGTAGTFKLTWAQLASSGTATRLFADSYLCLRRVD